MSNFIIDKSNEPTFSQEGLKGFQFPLKNKDIETYYVDVTNGHDNFIISKRITHIYYVISGQGYFTINNKKYDVNEGSLIEVPPNIEYTYSGKMKLLLIMNPPWSKGNETITKKNPSVSNN